jgi:hypothetical protein
LDAHEACFTVEPSAIRARELQVSSRKFLQKHFLEAVAAAGETLRAALVLFR